MTQKAWKQKIKIWGFVGIAVACFSAALFYLNQRQSNSIQKLFAQQEETQALLTVLKEELRHTKEALSQQEVGPDVSRIAKQVQQRMTLQMIQTNRLWLIHPVRAAQLLQEMAKESNPELHSLLNQGVEVLSKQGDVFDMLSALQTQFMQEGLSNMPAMKKEASHPHTLKDTLSAWRGLVVVRHYATQEMKAIKMLPRKEVFSSMLLTLEEARMALWAGNASLFKQSLSRFAMYVDQSVWVRHKKELMEKVKTCLEAGSLEEPPFLSKAIGFLKEEVA